MCMPVLLGLMIGIVWLGFSVIGQSEVTVEARHEGWQQRFDEGSERAMNFLSDDFVTEEKNSEVDMGPLFDDVSGPESSHDVAIDTWDHNRIDMNQAPNWELYLTAALNAKTGGLQVAYEDARGMLSSLQKDAARQVVEEMTNVIREMLENPLGNFKGGADESKREADTESDKKKSQLKNKIAKAKREIKEVKEHLRDLKDEKKNAEDEDSKKSLNSRIEVNENKLKRLKKALKRLESDYKATG